MEDCRSGKIDVILTKSISRFARNTVTLLQAVRDLKELGIDVFFEEQNIHTMSADGELMLTILASYAQEESRSVSENQKWRIKKNFEAGIPWSATLLGYRLQDGQYRIVPEEAVIVKRIYSEYLHGYGATKIAKMLTDDHIPTRYGEPWLHNTIMKILQNYNYTGNLLLQKTFRESHLSRGPKVNEGQLPQYLVEDAHEPIIDMTTFNLVQEEIERRRQKYAPRASCTATYPYSGLLTCSTCGKNYHRKVLRGKVLWMCPTYSTLGKKYCASKQIPEIILDEVIATVTDDLSTITKIDVAESNILWFHMVDGRKLKRIWKDHSRAASWTPEMREAARKRALERRKQNAESSHSDTGNQE